MRHDETTPWYKNKWPWLVFSIPLLTIVAGLITYRIAVDNPHSLVQDDYFKKGLAINLSLEKQTRAREYGLQANISLDKDGQLLLLNLETAIGSQSEQKTDSTDKESVNVNFQPERLVLTFSHPTQEKLDFRLGLDRLSQGEYVAQLPALEQAYWYVRLSDPDESWLIKSRWHYPRDQQLVMQASSK